MQFRRAKVGGTVIVVLSLLGVCLSVGCVGKEGIYQGMYDGLKARDRIENPRPTTQFPREEPMSYQQYKSEREKLLKKDDSQ